MLKNPQIIKLKNQKLKENILFEKQKDSVGIELDQKGYKYMVYMILLNNKK